MNQFCFGLAVYFFAEIAYIHIDNVRAAFIIIIPNVLLNFVTEYLFDTFVVFRGSMDTNDLAKKEEQK